MTAPEGPMTPREKRLLANLLRAQAAQLDMDAAAIDATAAMQKLGDVLRRANEADFMDLVLNYDEDSIEPGEQG